MSIVSNGIIDSFFGNERVSNIIKYGKGHINETYLVTLKSGKYILQKVNRSVFDVESLINNYTLLNNYVKSKGINNKIFPSFKLNNSGLIHSIDSDGGAWRVTKFIENCPKYSISPNIATTERAGKTMGQFQLFLAELNYNKFKDTILDFHNPKRRFKDFKIALDYCSKEVISSAQEEINFALNNKYIAFDISELLSSNVLPNRLTHNDTKLDNILFDLQNDKTYVIDLDTIMKGTILFDFGDMVRSITSLAKEDEKDLSKVIFNIDHFKALSKGYFGELKEIITHQESENMLNGSLCIIFTQGIRFLTDYLAGNKYYKADYSTHNLVRCRTQFKLLRDMIDMRNELEEIISSSLK